MLTKPRVQELKESARFFLELYEDMTERRALAIFLGAFVNAAEPLPPSWWDEQMRRFTQLENMHDWR